MPDEITLLKAELREIRWQKQEVKLLDKVVPVQFNPESLKVAYANQSSGGDQRGGAAIQFVGAGTTKLSFDLWFDATVPQPDGRRVDDVRRLTQDIIYFMRPRKTAKKGQFTPPGVRFLWGTFLFDGVMDSINESLEFFSEEAKPLRARVSVGLSQQEIQFQFGQQQSRGLPTTGTPATEPMEQVREGDTVHDVAARRGAVEKWLEMARANGIENSRLPETGAFLITPTTQEN